MSEKIAMRAAFGEALLENATTYPNMVVLDADVSNSTQTVHFGKQYPDRFFNLGAAEANLVDVAGGMALCGLKPVASTFAIFLTLKATEQIRNNICYNNLPVILIGGYAGLSDSFDGASHQSITDIAIMRAMPNMKVLVPGDAYEMKQAFELALKEKGPVYIRSSRNPSPTLFKDAPPMESGKIRRIKNGTDITIAVCGIPAYMAIEATETLEKEDVSVDLLNVSSIKPLDEETILESVKKTGKILTIEEHNVIGGLGGAISELLCKEHPVYAENIGIEDVFAETGPYIDLLAKYGISEESIVYKAKKLIQKSKS
jgi:transketolase